jgi:hypothetical protein
MREYSGAICPFFNAMPVVDFVANESQPDRYKAQHGDNMRVLFVGCLPLQE